VRKRLEQLRARVGSPRAAETTFIFTSVRPTDECHG
jgi:hypothetical protein